MLEIMTQAQIAHNHDIDMMVKTLYSHPLIISYVTNHSVRAKESCCFENQDSISAYPSKPVQTSNVKYPIDILASYLKLNLSMNMILNFHLIIQFHFLIQL